jgi:hypothetical protein
VLNRKTLLSYRPITYFYQAFISGVHLLHLSLKELMLLIALFLADS